MRSTVIAVGNILRRDDGVAHRVLDLLGPRTGVSRRGVLQLTPEIAAEIANSGLVFFLDADPGAVRPYLAPVEADPGRRTPTAHSMTPAEVILLARHLYGFAGTASLCHLPAADLSEGRTLTPEAEAGARAAAHLITKELASCMSPR
jgi:hydrogenase maturation protease